MGNLDFTTAIQPVIKDVRTARRTSWPDNILFITTLIPNSINGKSVIKPFGCPRGAVYKIVQREGLYFADTYSACWQDMLAHDWELSKD